MKVDHSPIFWFFGRSGAGKTTLAQLTAEILRYHSVPVVLLDGDDIRRGLSSDLGFDEVARTETHRRVAEVAKICSANGVVTLAATIAPQHIQREAVNRIVGAFVSWIYVDAPLEVCAERDPKGLYSEEREGFLDDLSSYPFDDPPPGGVDLRCRTAQFSLDECVRMVSAHCFRVLAIPRSTDSDAARSLQIKCDAN